MTNRKDVPEFKDKLTESGDSRIFCNNFGSLAVKWQDTKVVIVPSSCHKCKMTEVSRTAKGGTKRTVPCPRQFYFISL